jgi:hypothetical protein
MSDQKRLSEVVNVLVNLVRNQSAAHYGLRRSGIPNYPKFDLALESACFYYEFVAAELRKVGIEQRPDDLREYSKSFSAECREIARAAMNATDKFKENVY